jgi:hypothetical protein
MDSSCAESSNDAARTEATLQAEIAYAAQFKAGDRVRCVIAHGSEETLECGKLYTVECDSQGGTAISVSGILGAFFAKRFVKVDEEALSLLARLPADELEPDELEPVELEPLDEVLRWVDVDERLPDEDRLVLVYAPDSTSERVWPAYVIDDAWHCPSGFAKNDVVTHWAELPVGPKGGAV